MSIDMMNAKVQELRELKTDSWAQLEGHWYPA